MATLPLLKRHLQHPKHYFQEPEALRICRQQSLVPTVLQMGQLTAFGVLLIGALYIFRQNRMYQCMIGAIGTIWEVTAPLAFLPVYFYNGDRGKLKLKYVFYWFYPLHLHYFNGCGIWSGSYPL